MCHFSDRLVMATRELDITGQPCDACAKGVAKVVHFVKESGNDRFFFGCSASTKEAKCGGPRAWQSIRVPDELKVKALEEKGVKRVPKTRGRAKKQIDDKNGSDSSSDVVELEEVQTQTKTKVRTTTTRRVKRVKKSRMRDADHWTRGTDEDYAE